MKVGKIEEKILKVLAKGNRLSIEHPGMVLGVPLEVPIYDIKTKLKLDYTPKGSLTSLKKKKMIYKLKGDAPGGYDEYGITFKGLAYYLNKKRNK